MASARHTRQELGLTQDKQGNIDRLRVNLLWVELCNSVEFGLIETVKYLVINKAALTYEGPFPRRFRYGNVLEPAMLRSDTTMVNLLLKLGAPINHKTLGETILHRTVREAKTNIVKLLLEYGADTNIYSDSNETALHIAVEMGALDIVEILLAGGANINAGNNNGHSALSLALHFNQWNIFRTLLKHDPVIENNFLGRAISFQSLGQIDGIISHLTECKVPTAVFHKDYSNAIFTAIRNGRNVYILRNLLENGQMLDLVRNTTSHIISPLHVAVFYKQPQIVKLFINHGANVLLQDGHALTSVEYAMEMNELSMFDIFLEMKPSLRNMFLYLAVRSKQSNFVEHLLKNGANVFARFDDKSILEIACATNDRETINTLLQYGADPNVDTANGTLLQKLFDSDPLNTEALLNYGADINKVDEEGHTPITWPLPLYYENTPWNDNICINRFSRERFGASLIAAGLYVSKHTADWFDINCTRFWYDYNAYETAISNIKRDEIGDFPHSICMYVVLRASVNHLAKIAKNETLYESLETRINKYVSRNHKYGGLLKARLNMGKIRRQYLDRGQASLQTIFTGLPTLCIENIVSYISNEDLNTLCSRSSTGTPVS